MSNFESHKYRGHTIEFVPKLGWSDSHQKPVPNGFQVRVDGPYCSINQQTYVPDINYFKDAIDRALAKSGDVK